MKIKNCSPICRSEDLGISVVVPDSERGLSAAVKDKIKPK